METSVQLSPEIQTHLILLSVAERQFLNQVESYCSALRRSLQEEKDPRVLDQTLLRLQEIRRHMLEGSARQICNVLIQELIDRRLEL